MTGRDREEGIPFEVWKSRDSWGISLGFMEVMGFKFFDPI
jgi:hypothetical protein